MDRNETIKRIRAGLRKRSGKAWSVKGGRGTAWGWIRVSAPPARLVDGYISDDDRRELATLLGIEKIHNQGENIPCSNQYYQEYVDRAEGYIPRVVGRPYWD